MPVPLVELPGVNPNISLVTQVCCRAVEYSENIFCCIPDHIVGSDDNAYT
jgi:hypothetical protein